MHFFKTNLSICITDGATAVRFYCKVYAAQAPVYIYRTHSFGQTHSRRAGGSMYTTTIEVPLAASSTYVEFDFRTSDSNGTIANWELVY